MSKLDAIKETIKNLRARASDEASSESEAMAAIAHADKLMQKHELTVEDLEIAVNVGGIVKAEWTRGTRKLHPVEYVANAVSQLSETKGWVVTDSEKQALVFMGFDPDVEFALYLIDLVYNAMEIEWEAFRAGAAYENTPRNRRGKLREDFMRGMAGRIREKMTEMVAVRRTQAPEVKSGGTGLVVAKRNMIAEALAAEDINIRKRRASKKKKVDASAYFAGREAGDRTNITTGIEA
ncbi:hypothetical protein MAL1_00149 [Bacteriophage DSS3_MAL1]|nr:hypothetical protein MAL1_00149 [Bacteriophage DSS3_MAL1]